MLPPDAKRPDSVEGANLLVIHPCSRWKTVFDLLVATCILYTAVVAPVQVCYQHYKTPRLGPSLGPT